MAAVASTEDLKSAKPWSLVLDVRDPEEVESGKGGPPFFIEGSVNVPLNINGQKQSEKETTLEDFKEQLAKAGIALPEDRTASIVAHCGHGARGGKATAFLRDLGYTNAVNGGGPAHIAEAL